MSSVSSISDEDLILLHDLKTTCFKDGYSCHLSNDDFTVTSPDQLSYWLGEITYSELSPESAALFSMKVYYCNCCVSGSCLSSTSYSCSRCEKPYYDSNDYFSLYKNDSALYSFVSYSDIKKEYESRGLNNLIENTDNSLTNIIRSKLNMEDIFDSIFIITSSIILLFFISKILMKFISFFEK